MLKTNACSALTCLVSSLLSSSVLAQHDLAWQGFVAQGLISAPDSGFVNNDGGLSAELTEVGVNGRYSLSPSWHLAGQLLRGKGLVSLTKGIEAQTFKLMSEILQEIAPQARIGVLSGPNLAREVAEHALTATVVASEDEALCQAVQAALHGRTFRVYASGDRFGVELGGALKNVYAIIAGMAVALGMGENTKSMLITRALAEMTRFAVNQGANPMTFLGLAGVGDLIVTCSSPKSRNYQVGFALGQGLSLEEAVTRLGEVAEGVNTLKVLKAKAQEVGVYMPLVAGLHAILFEGRTLEQVIELLMRGEPKTDVDFISTSGFN